MSTDTLDASAQTGNSNNGKALDLSQRSAYTEMAIECLSSPCDGRLLEYPLEMGGVHTRGFPGADRRV